MRINSVALPVVLACVLAGCSSSHSTGTSTPTPGPSRTTSSQPGTAGTVHDLMALRGNRWSVATLALKVGDTVKVTDSDPDVPHNFHVPGVGQSGTLSGGDTFSLRFTKAGTFDFVCTFHQAQGMVGTITVS